jgi:hypothetical protein
MDEEAEPRSAAMVEDIAAAIERGQAAVEEVIAAGSENLDDAVRIAEDAMAKAFASAAEVIELAQQAALKGR